MMYKTRKDGKVDLIVKTATTEKELDTTVNSKAQQSYKEKCKELQMKYKPLVNAPQPYKSFDDENARL